MTRAGVPAPPPCRLRGMTGGMCRAGGCHGAGTGAVEGPARRPPSLAGAPTPLRRTRSRPRLSARATVRRADRAPAVPGRGDAPRQADRGPGRRAAAAGGPTGRAGRDRRPRARHRPPGAAAAGPRPAHAAAGEPGRRRWRREPPGPTRPGRVPLSGRPTAAAGRGVEDPPPGRAGRLAGRQRRSGVRMPSRPMPRVRVRAVRSHRNSRFSTCSLLSAFSTGHWS